ncbi:hypothetical protein A4U53_030675 [Rhizobium ruizarguesonis]|uniref:Uncharacterized protein n=1 Tax=Rhizobium ruizarguesonis TaxID=2081791 RepID=A0ACD5EMB7_9HYPH|nr:hypothetical protein [Rhizobium leguminosarum]
MGYCHPKESAHAQDAREARERALGLPSQSLLNVGYYSDNQSPSSDDPDIDERHPDDIAVDNFAAAMKVKLAEKRSQARGGWDDKDDCSALWLSELLREHVEKGCPLDVGNFAMMLHQRGERIASLLDVLRGE